MFDTNNLGVMAFLECSAGGGRRQKLIVPLAGRESCLPAVWETEPQLSRENEVLAHRSLQAAWR